MYTKRKRRNFDISSTGCTENLQRDTLRCNQWRGYRQNDDVSFSLKWNVFNHHYHGPISQRVYELIILKVQRNKRKTVAPLQTMPNHVIILHMPPQLSCRRQSGHHSNFRFCEKCIFTKCWLYGFIKLCDRNINYTNELNHALLSMYGAWPSSRVFE